MKRIFTTALTLVICASVNAQSQIGNAGFENWENVSSGQEPVNWNSFKTASGGQSGFGAVQIESSTDVRPGSTGTRSARIYSRDVIFGIIANGNMTTGRINMGATSADHPENHNRSITADPAFSEAINSRPDSIVFWVKFVPNGSSSSHLARMKATLHGQYDYKDPEDANSSAQVVASAELNYPSTGGQWVRKSIPFTYTANAIEPRFMLVTFTTNFEPGGGSENDQVWVDDVELIYNPPTFTTSVNSICQGSTISYNNTTVGPNAGNADFTWTFPGGTPATSTAANPTVTYNTPGTYNVTLSYPNGDQTITTTITNHVAINAILDATFAYSNANYCSNVNNPVPTTNATGTFTASSSNLVFANTTTGEINLEASAAGTYTITHTTPGLCSTTANQSITIFEGSDASFSYPTNTICILEGNQTPTVTNAGGTFTSSTGLTFENAATGEISTSGSTAGTYEISYVIGGGCPDTVVTTVTLTEIPNATFSYSNPAYCLNANAQNPIFATGANAGIFTSTAGLVINANNGSINIGNSTPGTYTISNNIAENGACPAASHSFDITINELPVVTLTLDREYICVGTPAFLLTGGAPAGGNYSGTGIGANIFNPAPFNPGNNVNVTYTFTNTTTGCSNSATDTYVFDACLAIEEQVFEDVTVFPNPTTGILNIKNIQSDATFMMFSLSGQVVAAGDLMINADTIDFSNIENGVYLLQITQGTNLQTVRVVKQ